MGLNTFVRSKTYKQITAKLYGVGASVVIVGALFKINHWPGASETLIVGMLTEAVIFFLSAFEPLHVTYDWSLVYPELAGMEDLTPQEEDERRQGRRTRADEANSRSKPENRDRRKPKDHTPAAASKPSSATTCGGPSCHDRISSAPTWSAPGRPAHK